MAKKDHLEHLREIRVKHPRPPLSITELVGSAYFTRLLRKKTRVDRLREAWIRICGSLLAEHSEVKSFKAGEVRITCTSQAMAAELTTHRHSEMLTKLNAELGGKDRVAKIIFRAGRI